MEVKKPYFSPTQVAMHGFCEQQYQFRYIEGIKSPPGVALVKGRAIHRAAEINYRQKVSTGQDLPIRDLTDMAAAEYDLTIRADGIALTDEEASKGHQVVIGQGLDSTVRLTGLYGSVVAPKVDPALVEETVRIELPQAPYDLLGRLDVADKSGTIIDLKTAGRSKTQSEVDSSLQLTWYTAAYRWLTKHPATGVQLDVLVDLKTPKVQTLRSERSEQDVQVMLNRVNAMAAILKTGTIKPAPIGHPLCSPRFCGYWNICPWVNRERKESVSTEE